MWEKELKYALLYRTTISIKLTKSNEMKWTAKARQQQQVSNSRKYAVSKYVTFPVSVSIHRKRPVSAQWISSQRSTAKNNRMFTDLCYHLWLCWSLLFTQSFLSDNINRPQRRAECQIKLYKVNLFALANERICRLFVKMVHTRTVNGGFPLFYHCLNQNCFKWR